MRTVSPLFILSLAFISVNAIGQANPRLIKQYGKLPLSFEVNKGQTDKQVNFLSRGSGYSLFLTPNEAVFSLSKPQARPKNGKKCAPVAPSVLRMKLLGANPNPKSVGEAKLPGTVNYFKGNDPKKWHTNIRTYSKVRYQSVYKGIDQVFYGNQRKLEYDFVVSPFADYKQVKMEFAGAKSVKLLKNGDLELNLKGGSVKWQAPLVYQEANGGRIKVAGKYVLLGKRRVGFEVARYDKSKPLVIDPVLTYSTFLGGSAEDIAEGVAIDSSGNTYVAGRTASTDFPTTVGAYTTTHSGSYDAYVTKLNASGTALIYSTFLSNGDASGITVDSLGCAYITGGTMPFAGTFPSTAGAFQTSVRGSSDAFITKLSADGDSLIYSTFLGGDGLSGTGGTDVGRGIAVDISGNAYVTGSTFSVGFPTTSGVFDETRNDSIFHGDAFVTKLNADGSSLVYSTILGGTTVDEGYGIAVDGTGNAYVTGYTADAGGDDFPTTIGAFDTTHNSGIGNISYDAFVTKVSADGSSLIYSTFLGGGQGGGQGGHESGYGIAVDTSGHAYVTGVTSSADFPTTASAFATSKQDFDDAFVTKLSTDGSSLVYSTYLGGEGSDRARAIALDSTGVAYITGITDSSGFPTTSAAYDTTQNGSYDGFLTSVSTDGTSLVYSTYFGGTNGEEAAAIAVDSFGNVVIAGYSGSSFPTTIGAFDTTHNGSELDAFVVKFGSRKLSLIVPDIQVQYEAKPVVQATLVRPDIGTPYTGKFIVFKIDGVSIKTMKTNASGVATFNYDLGNRAVGVYNLTATYAGDANFDPITVSATLRVLRSGVKIVLAPTVLSTKHRLGLPMSPIISFTMSRTSDNVKLPNETFDVELDGTTIGTVTTDANGVATLPYTPPASLGAGSKVLKAKYTATATYSGLTTGWNLSFIKTPTFLTAPSIAGNHNTAVNLTATLTNKDTSTALEGKTVKFFVGGGYVGQATTNISGLATLSYTLGGTVQKQALTTTFEGDELFGASSRNTILSTR